MKDRDNRRLARAENLLLFCENNRNDHTAFPVVAEHLGIIAVSVSLVINARADQAPNRITKSSIIDAQLTLINTEVDILDPIMGNIYEFQPEKLHAWKRASRVERDPKRSQPDPEDGGTTPPAPLPA